MTGVGEQIEHLVADVVARAGVELVQVEVRGAGRSRVLRVLLDEPGGIGLDDCERVSRALSAALDEDGGQELLPGGYTLEVSSPGLDRPLVKPADFVRFAGARARVKTRRPIEGSRNWTGRIEASGQDGVRLQPEERGRAPVVVAWDNVEAARLAPLGTKVDEG